MEIKNFIIKGLIVNTLKQALPNLRVEAWDKDLLINDLIGSTTTDENGEFSFEFSQSYFREIFTDRKPDIFFRIFSEGNQVYSTESDVLWNVDSSIDDITITVDLAAPGTSDPSKPVSRSYKVTGKVVNNKGVPVRQAVVEVLIKNADGDIPVGKTQTNRTGNYEVSFIVSRNRLSPDIQVLVYQKGNEDHVTRSAIRFNVSGNEVIDVIVDSAKVRGITEFESLKLDIGANLGKLQWNDLKEDAEHQHITFLSNKTGWDGRLTAMLALSHQLGSQLKIDPSHVYALLRSGVPGTAEALKSISSSALESALKTAVEKRIIQETGSIEETIKTLNTLSINHVLEDKPFASLSSLGEMLGLRLNDDQKIVFAKTCKQVGDDPEKLWTSLQEKGFSGELVSHLKLDGKMGFLTGNNVPLMNRIYKNYDVQGEFDLVHHGLYKDSEWKKIIGNDKPVEITADEYARHMTKTIKLSYPTAVACEMINREEINLGKNIPKDEIVGFMKSNEAKKNIGIHPVKQWDGFEELSIPAKAAVKTLQRIYQITPSDDSMVVLANNGFHSAYQIARYSPSEFLSMYADKFSNIHEAQLTYTKASEVYSASLGIATTYLTSRIMPNVYAITGKTEKTPEETIAYPTLEELFGNMDYCTCDHCKSVLSPAAYLVELLEFIDLTGSPIKKSNPVSILFNRRPDIQHIQLTCENTNLALPYIDLVNEILEYYILHGNLDNLKGHDVNEETTQADLLAEPQFVEKTAYDHLKQKVYPYNLPFHQPLETLRRLFKLWDVSLEDGLNIFSDTLASRKETLVLNEQEYETLTSLTSWKLPEYFGLPAAFTLDQINTAISGGKTFCRTVGISYEDLVELLKTNFINPGFRLVPLFQKLHVNLVDLQKFYKGTLSDVQMDALIPAEIDPADYGGNVKAWLRANQNLIMGLITLTDMTPETTECSFADVQLRYALPDNFANTLTSTAYHKFHRFLRLLRKTGWKIPTLDQLIKVLLPVPSELITDANIDSVFVTLIDRLANFKKITGFLSYSEKKFPGLLLILDSEVLPELRMEQCARLLKLSKPELGELIAITGIDPLTSDFDSDEPSLVKLLMISRALKAQSLKVPDLAYLLNHVDMNSKLILPDELLIKNIKTIRDTLSTIERENAIAPANADFNLAKSKMLLIYDPVTTDQFFGLLLNTTTYSASFVTLEEGIPKPLADANPKLGFDLFKKELTFIGAITNAEKTSLENTADGLVLADMEIISTPADLAIYIADFKVALNNLAITSNIVLADFATGNPELKVIFDSVLMEPTPEAQASLLVKLLLPGLKFKMKSTALQQALSGILKTDPEIAGILLSKKEVLKSAGDPTKGISNDFMELEQKLVFDQIKTYSFYIDFPLNDDYLIYLSAPENSLVSLTIDDLLIMNNVTVGPEKEVKNAAPLSLKKGIRKAELKISALPAGQQMNIWWRTKGISKTMIPDAAMYDSEKVNFAKTSLIKLFKAAQLQNLFRFTPVELEYFSSMNTETKDFLNNLDTDGTISATDLVALWEKIGLLVYFNSIKKENEPEDNVWVTVLNDPSVKNKKGEWLLESFNLWKETDVTEILNHFSLNRSDLSKLSILRKVKNAVEFVKSTGYPASVVKTWINGNPSYDLVKGIKDLIRQNVTEASWLESMQTVNDPVRNLLRDALVSYILHYQRPSPEIVNPDKLYEYFLIDVEMDACMKTSRIRQAISTVQLFIQRCLINLEPLVDPASIKSEQWAWFKRYRIWEANRKVFLNPESYLEPELRDNKSSLFRELEGELLQGEVTDESAELAFLNYLKKLDDIAKLDIVGMYLEENEQNNQDDDILHVFGRTNGNTRQYYYRRYEYGYWTPWEKVNLNIEGEHLFPIVWRKRLFVFWLSIFEKPADVNGTKTPQGMSIESMNTNARKNIELTLCWGEYFKGKWTSPKSSELKRAVLFNDMVSFESKDLLVYARKQNVENPAGKFRERVVFLLRYGYYNAVLTFTSKNAPPYIEYIEDGEILNKVGYFNYNLYRKPYEKDFWPSELYNTQLLMPGRKFMVNVPQPPGALSSESTETILTKSGKLTGEFLVLPIRHITENQYEAPLSYADEHSTFFIKPDEETFLSLLEFGSYYPVKVIEFLPDIPELIEKPIPDWPNEIIIDPVDELVIDNPWEKLNTNEINVNYTKVLQSTQPFRFGEAEFGTGGKNEILVKNNVKSF